MSTQKKLGAGWTKQSKNDEYINVKITQDIPAGSFIQVYKNDRKLSSKHPDYNVVCYIHSSEPAK